MSTHSGDRRDINIQRIQQEMLNSRGPRRSTKETVEEEVHSGAQSMRNRDDELIETLKEENESLRGIVAELRQMLEEGGGHQGGGGEGFAEREREYESIIEEKTEIIQKLHGKMQELETELEAKRAIKPTPDREELLALSDELERERCQLEQERRTLETDTNQLREDEESMMGQMREMELQMAKERAELARQRNELQRLHSEIRHELESAQRDSAVNERLKLLQRRHREVEEGGKGGGDKPSPKGAPPPKKESGSGMSIMKRLFGGGDTK
jgi:chromosome segregation ATPase